MALDVARRKTSTSRVSDDTVVRDESAVPCRSRSSSSREKAWRLSEPKAQLQVVAFSWWVLINQWSNQSVRGSSR